MIESQNPTLVCAIVWINQSEFTLQLESNVAARMRLSPGEQSLEVTFTPVHLFKISTGITSIGDRPQGKISLTWRTVEDKYALIQQNNDGPEIALQLLPRISHIPKNLLVTLVVDDGGILIVGTIDVQDGLPPDDRVLS